jgi:hypothetical protein
MQLISGKANLAPRASDAGAIFGTSWRAMPQRIGAVIRICAMHQFCFIDGQEITE